MSKRSDRRAAERAAHKTNRTQTLTAAQPLSTHAAAASAASPTSEEDFLAQIQADFARTEALLAKLDREADRRAAAQGVSVQQPATPNLSQDHQANIMTDAEFFAEIEAAQRHTREYLASQNANENINPNATEAQINANRQNAKHSTGPVTDQGKQTVSQNRRSHGLIGRFLIQPDENQADYDALAEEIYTEYQPASLTEIRLAQSLLQHYWLMQRALRLQEEVLRTDDKKLALYMRYQTTHERSYYKAQKELQKLRKEAAQSQIGFERQNQKAENLEARTRLAHAKAQTIEINSACRQVMDAPIPGTHKLSFEDLTKACSEAIADLVFKTRMTAEAAA